MINILNLTIESLDFSLSNKLIVFLMNCVRFPSVMRCLAEFTSTTIEGLVYQGYRDYLGDWRARGIDSKSVYSGTSAMIKGGVGTKRRRFSIDPCEYDAMNLEPSHDCFKGWASALAYESRPMRVRDADAVEKYCQNRQTNSPDIDGDFHALSLSTDRSPCKTTSLFLECMQEGQVNRGPDRKVKIGQNRLRFWGVSSKGPSSY